MNKLWFLLFLFSSSQCSDDPQQTDKRKTGNVIACYVMSWSVYRPDEGKFNMNDIDPFLCTHVIYSYTSINSTNWNIQSEDEWADFGVGNMKKLTGLKKVNPDLKILTCLGGWSEGSEKFSNMSSNKDYRKQFIDSVIQYLQKNKLDGLDIDWQYPTKRGGIAEDKQNFPILLEELRKEFDKVNYTLTVRLMGSRYASQGYDLPRISTAVHFINLRSFSYHETWESVTGVYAPLKSEDEDNVEFSINYFLEQGVSGNKLLLGLSTEGNAFIMNSPVNEPYIKHKANGGFKGPWTSENGVMGYNEICWNLTRTNHWTEHWDSNTLTPYSINGNMFTSYENTRSIEKKILLVEKYGLGGISMYTLDKDDFKGYCYDEEFILTNKAKSLLRKFNFEVEVINLNFSQ